MLLYLAAGLWIIAILYSSTNIFWAAAVYLCAGFIWYSRYYLGKPSFSLSPYAYHPVILLLLTLLWPLGALYEAYGHYRLLRHPQRFLVLYGNTGESRLLQTPYQTRFASWDKAIAFARKEAAQSGYPSLITDLAEYAKTPLLGNRDNVSYSVSPTGDIKRDN